ncbi:hypothetical protein JL720_11282 [Aureococcus anophagefferens]|nr:hypothetical protein JL720_11282 [Aureococcus anophagefferens]
MWRSLPGAQERVDELLALVAEDKPASERPPMHVLKRLIDERLEDEDKWVQITAGCVSRELGIPCESFEREIEDTFVSKVRAAYAERESDPPPQPEWTYGDTIHDWFDARDLPGILDEELFKPEGPPQVKHCGVRADAPKVNLLRKPDASLGGGRGRGAGGRGGAQKRDLSPRYQAGLAGAPPRSEPAAIPRRGRGRRSRSGGRSSCSTAPPKQEKQVVSSSSRTRSRRRSRPRSAPRRRRTRSKPRSPRPPRRPAPRRAAPARPSLAPPPRPAPPAPPKRAPAPPAAPAPAPAPAPAAGESSTLLGDDCNLATADVRALFQAFLEKRPKPANAADKVKIHEETKPDDKGVNMKSSIFLVLDWAAYTYKRTRKRKPA